MNSAGGLKVQIGNGGMTIVHEGKVRKSVKRVEQISFSAKRALKLGQEVHYVTERAVFRVAPDGIELIEIALGIDVKSQVLNMMEFTPIIRKVSLMPARLFQAG